MEKLIFGLLDYKNFLEYTSSDIENSFGYDRADKQMSVALKREKDDKEVLFVSMGQYKSMEKDKHDCNLCRIWDYHINSMESTQSSTPLLKKVIDIATSTIFLWLLEPDVSFDFACFGFEKEDFMDKPESVVERITKFNLLCRHFKRLPVSLGIPKNYLSHTDEMAKFGNFMEWCEHLGCTPRPQMVYIPREELCRF